MRIAFTHNLQVSDSEEEAEFDTPETVAMILRALRDLGHEVEPVEVSGTPSRVVARLEALSPDLVFNTAEGTRGRFREAFYPALFDRLGFPFTGSDAYVCALTLDKQLTKMVLATHGVHGPRGAVAHDAEGFDVAGFRFPVILKPNYEGSSMGITADSVVESETEMRSRLFDLLHRFPAGILVEEYIVGRDLVVPFLEKASPSTGGVLEPASYHYDKNYVGDRKYEIYDYDLKTVGFDAVEVRVPAEIPKEARDKAMQLSRLIFKALGVRDAGRIDFRLGDDGELYFLEINALPSLEKGASIFRSGALAGLETERSIFEAIVRSAASRHGLSLRTSKRSKRQKIRVGITFNLKQAAVDEHADDAAEHDAPETIAALGDALRSYGHDVVELEATPELPAILPASGVDVVFNIAEGFAGRARESQVPAMLELIGIPYTGSDPTALSLALDKALAKRLVQQAGFSTPAFLVMNTGKEKLPKGLIFPCIAKPAQEGSSKGILKSSVVKSEAELRELAKEIVGRYRQPVLVESFLPGREFTVGLLGERRPRVLPPMEVIFKAAAGTHPVYSLTSKLTGQNEVENAVPADIESQLKRELERYGKGIFAVLGCRDVARVDLRLDAAGQVHFIECNPLPGLAPGWSDLCLIAEAAGISYRGLIGEILAPAIRRLREKRRERTLEARG